MLFVKCIQHRRFIVTVANDKFEQHVELEPRKVTCRYITGWFIPDLLASIPAGMIILLLDGSAPELLTSTHLLKVLRLLRLAKALRLFRYSKVFKGIRFARLFCVERCGDCHTPDWLGTILQTGVIYFLLVHWLGCANVLLVKLHK